MGRMREHLRVGAGQVVIHRLKEIMCDAVFLRKKLRWLRKHKFAALRRETESRGFRVHIESNDTPKEQTRPKNSAGEGGAQVRENQNSEKEEDAKHNSKNDAGC